MENLHPFILGSLCSVVVGSDVYASKVIATPTPKSVVVQHVKIKCHDWWTQDNEIFDEVDPLSEPTTFTMRRNGIFVEKGYSRKDGAKLSTVVKHYMDPNF